MNVAFWNAHSLTKVKQQFLTSRHESIKIINETWLNDLKQNGYNVIKKIREDQRGGGVAIFIK